MEIHRATDFSELLDLLKASKKRGTKMYSYNELANKLGFKSPRSLAMVKKRQRAPSAGLVRTVCDYLAVTPKQREFIHWLAEKSRLEKKGLSTVTVDLKIERFRAMHAPENGIEALQELPGIQVQIDPSVQAPIRSRLEEVLRELAFEFGQSGVSKAGTKTSESN
jgi:hypothetical protein